MSFSTRKDRKMFPCLIGSESFGGQINAHRKAASPLFRDSVTMATCFEDRLRICFEMESMNCGYGRGM